MSNKLSLKNINVKYGESLALKSINLDIYKGEFVVLLGSSGAGKSTLLRTINQLNPLTSGELDFFDLGKIRNKKSKNLILPHPRSHLRNFVLYPILQIDPNWSHPILKKNARFLINNLSQKSRIEITRLQKNVNIQI